MAVRRVCAAVVSRSLPKRRPSCSQLVAVLVVKYFSEISKVSNSSRSLVIPRVCARENIGSKLLSVTLSAIEAKDYMLSRRGKLLSSHKYR